MSSFVTGLVQKKGEYRHEQYIINNATDEHETQRQKSHIRHFFVFAAVFYLVHEKYPFLRNSKGNELVPVVIVHDGIR